MKRKAFTLVELLVVIAIIGLLSTVAVIATNSARISARNTKRVADIKQLATAFNLAYNVNGTYPDSSATPGGWDCMSGDACLVTWSTIIKNDTVDGIMIPAFLGAKPSDQIAGTRPLGGYVYGNAWVGGTGPSGIVFSAGPVLLYALEGAFACPLGLKWTGNSAFTECIMALDGRF